MSVKNKVGLSFFSISCHCELKGFLQWSQSSILTNIDKLLFGIPDPSAFVDSTKWIASFPKFTIY